MCRAEEAAHLTASGPALLKAVLARVKAAEERLAATRYDSSHLKLRIVVAREAYVSEANCHET